MHPIANHLIQLQELTLVREEQRVALGGGHLEQLEDSINSMQQQLPDPVRIMYGKLSAKDRSVIVPVVDGLCVACRMQVPISLVQQVRMAKELHACPNCARYLYISEVMARNTRAKPGRFDVQKPGISRFSSQALMVSSLQGKDRDSVITELAMRMESEGFVDNGASLVESALRRETLFSTAVDHGLAFPHVRGVEGGALTLAVGLSAKGVHFDGGKGALSRVFFFMVIPTAASSFYLKLLAGLTETFMIQEARDALLACKTDADMWKALVKLTRKAIK